MASELVELARMNTDLSRDPAVYNRPVSNGINTPVQEPPGQTSAEADINSVNNAEVNSEALTLRQSVEQTLETYFTHLDGHDASDIYNMVLAEVEPPLLEVVMRYTHHNQSKAAEMLGLNRGTLRKKLKLYGLLK